jgi:putative transposase
MTISAIRRVSGAYASAARNGRPAARPFAFRRQAALCLIGKRGRDADFRADGTISIWTIAGRKRLSYTLPEPFRATFERAREIDSLTVIERDGRLLGRVTLTVGAPDPAGTHSVGVDLNETNTVVAVAGDDRGLFISGKETKVRNLRTSKTRSRLQRRLATRKAEGKDTRSVRRALKRHGRSRRNRTRTFAQQAAKRLVVWAGTDSILVFEVLKGIPRPRRGEIGGKAIRRRLSLWQRREIRTAVEYKAQEAGLLVVEVDPRYTSQVCSRCGFRGSRKRHRFSCSARGFAAHADINAAQNIRLRYTVSRDRGLSSCSPEARSSDAGKPSVLADGS